jgi:low temperature requirement protein LtrA
VLQTIWRPPHLRPETAGTRDHAVTWTELFYDLVFVVAVANVGRRFWEEPTGRGVIEFAALFALLWWAWASYTFLVDRYTADDPLHRLLAVAQMFGVAGMAAACDFGDRHLATISVAFAASYVVTRIVLLLMYARVWWHVEDSRPLVSGYLRGFGFETLLWVVSLFVPPPARYVLWAAAFASSLATPWLMRRAQVRSPLSASHVPERFGLFTILVLGELVTATVAGLHGDYRTVGSVIGAGAALIVAAGLWWTYFDNMEGSIVRRDASRTHDWRPTAWIYSHLPLAMSVTLVGGALEHHIVAIADPDHVESAATIVSGCGLAITLLAMAMILVSTADATGGRSTRRRALFRVIGALAAIAIAVVGDARHLHPQAVLVALAGLLIVQVVLDIVDDVVSSAALVKSDATFAD